jgi:4-amino-4-deoxy-L-arabinose transferase-like glycosyltransferase
LALLALALRCVRLDFQPLWWDEGYSVWFATHPLGQMAALTARDIHPPLYYALLRGWILLLGAGPVALRLLSVGIGFLALPAIYLAGRRTLGTGVAALATVLLAVNPFHIYYSQEIRMYGLVALLSAAMLAAAWSLFDRPPEKSGALLFAPYVLVVTAALYTEYYTVFLPIGLTLFACWHWRRCLPALWRWLAAQAVCALLYLPWVVYAAPKLVPYIGNKVVMDADQPLSLLPYFGRHLSAFLAGHLEGPLGVWWPADLVLLLPIAVGLALLVRDDARARTPVRMLATVVLTALVLGYLVGLRYPFFPQRGERLQLLALPPFLLLAAAGLAGLARRSLASGLLAIGLLGALSAVSLCAFYTVPRYPNDDYRPLITQIVQQARPGDTVFCVYPWQVGYWRTYGDPGGASAVLTPSMDWGDALSGALDAALQGGHVFLPAHQALGAGLENRIESYLGRRARLFANQWYGPHTRLSAWAAEPAAVDQPLAGVPVQFAGAGLPSPLVLAAAGAGPGPVAAANAVLPLTLDWRSATTPPTLAVSVRLVDALGQIWAQHDYQPLGAIDPGSASLLSSSQPPGDGPSGQGAAGGPATGAAAGDALRPGGGGAAQGALGLSGSLSGAGWNAVDRLGLLVPAGTPPGRYRLAISVLQTEGDLPLAVLAAGGGQAGEGAFVGEVTVIAADRQMSLDNLPIAHPQLVDLSDGIRFLGYSTDDTPVMPGEQRKVSLFWQARARPGSDYTAFVQLLGAPGRAPLSLWQAMPGAADATSQWAPGTLMRTQAAFRPPADLADGRYTLIAGLFRASDGQRLVTQSGADHLTLGRITVRGRPHVMVRPSPAHGASETFGSFAHLIGYDLVASPPFTPGRRGVGTPGPGNVRRGSAAPVPAVVAPGTNLTLVLYWQALGTPDRAYTVFVHLLYQDGRQRGAGDSEPGTGSLPTTGWVPSEYLTDPHTIAVDPDAPAGSYRVAVGLYDPSTGQRLATADGSDQVILDATVQVGAR